jgi:hypothetical protein
MVHRNGGKRRNKLKKWQLRLDTFSTTIGWFYFLPCVIISTLRHLMVVVVFFFRTHLHTQAYDVNFKI